MISGEETMGFARHSERLCVSTDLSDQDAYLFDELENETFLHLQPGQFVVFLPHDVHRPGCATGEPGPVRKAIVKIDTVLLLE
ncbi:hypothetical protein GCM10010911_06860 [Paenibacillus nasutitermitis]|uniref:YhcH/YjgK/YiaL family protein n=1 Tax=Paenibacillus nasutitermitis TaxID=1652958 RepID=A0A917DNP0_9BACL|nr:hypothetical protein GCM10010911_06860 [Paenibacillus nasutitermitis]